MTGVRSITTLRSMRGGDRRAQMRQHGRDPVHRLDDVGAGLAVRISSTAGWPLESPAWRTSSHRISAPSPRRRSRTAAPLRYARPAAGNQRPCVAWSLAQICQLRSPSSSDALAAVGVAGGDGRCGRRSSTMPLWFERRADSAPPAPPAARRRRFGPDRCRRSATAAAPAPSTRRRTSVPASACPTSATGS